MLRKKISIFLLLLFTGLFLPLQKLLADDYGLGAAAGQTGLPGVGTTTAPGTAIATYLGKFAGAALALSGSIFLFLVVYGGIIILTSAGNQEKVGKGKNIIIWAIIGALILGAAYTITSLVFGVFT